MMYPTVAGASDGDGDGEIRIEKFLECQNLLFGRLDGFTDYLLTLCQEAHAVPVENHGTSTASPEEILGDDESLQIFYGESKDSSSGGPNVTFYGNSHYGLSLVYTPSQPAISRFSADSIRSTAAYSELIVQLYDSGTLLESLAHRAQFSFVAS